jgi:hypothetical protein
VTALSDRFRSRLPDTTGDPTKRAAPVTELTPEQLLDLAVAPESTTTGAGTVTERPAADVIALQRAAAEAAAAAPVNGRQVSGWASLRPAKVVPPGGT